jgi:GST-like protein
LDRQRLARSEEPEGSARAFPGIRRWFGIIDARPAVARARAVGKDHQFKTVNDEETKRSLFPLSMAVGIRVNLAPREKLA